MDVPEPNIYDLHSAHLEVFLVTIEQEIERDSAGLDSLLRRVRDAQLHARARESLTHINALSIGPRLDEII